MGFYKEGVWYVDKEYFEIIQKQNIEWRKQQSAYLYKHYPHLYKKGRYLIIK